MIWKQSEDFKAVTEQERPLIRLRSCSNLNHTGHTYCNCPFLFGCTVSSDSETTFEPLHCSQNITGFYFKTINTRQWPVHIPTNVF